MKKLLLPSIIMFAFCGITSAQTGSKFNKKTQTTTSAAAPTLQKAALAPSSDDVVPTAATRTAADKEAAAVPAPTTRIKTKPAQVQAPATTVKAAGENEKNNNLVQDKMQIGKIENSVPVLTANKEMLIKNYSKNLLELSAIKGDFTDVSIVLVAGAYYLVFKGEKFKSSLQLTTNSGINNSIILVEREGHVSCTTSACAAEPRGCVPARVGQACTPCANGGTCTKTVSKTSLLLEN